MWRVLEEIAREEDPAWAGRNLIQYFHQGAEAQKDILRWLAIFERRLDPEHEFSFPAHHPRYRGFCLMPRHWPRGTSWDAFDESTWRRLSVPPQPDRESLERAIDLALDAPSSV